LGVASKYTELFGSGRNATIGGEETIPGGDLDNIANIANVANVVGKSFGRPTVASLESKYN
jgi:hypothetical protein